MISSTLISKALIQKLKETKDHESLVDSLILFLEKNHLMKLLPGVVLSLESELGKENKIKTVEIKTSHEFSPELIKKIEDNFGVSQGGRVNVTVDPSLIGGFVVTGNNRILDASLKNSIRSLKELLVEQY